MELRIPGSKKTKSIVLFSMLVLAIAGCAKIPQFTDKPFTVDKNEFYRTVKVIALEPLVMPEMKQTARVRAEIESNVIKILKEAGFTAIPSDKYEALWTSLSKQEGGLYDPVTGKKNDAKVKEMRGRIREELRTQHQVDAIMRTSVIMTSAHFTSCKARWHGTEQDIGSCGFFTGNYYGKISVLSLLVQIEGREGTVVFMNAGGIQPAARLKAGLFTSAQFETIEDDALFNDETKNLAAVAIALDPLVRKQD
jgi:hypothetical protein